MPTIKQLIRNTRQPIRNVTKSPQRFGDALSDEEHVLGCMCDSVAKAIGFFFFIHWNNSFGY
uniref:Uncharacterized protein n=1 Tax=Brassica campestris TaxID=3711 RepID=A0A3P6E2B5_BRACM|nr:unnamed protein product [Brassica rapa]